MYLYDCLYDYMIVLLWHYCCYYVVLCLLSLCFFTQRFDLCLGVCKCRVRITFSSFRGSLYLIKKLAHRAQPYQPFAQSTDIRNLFFKFNLNILRVFLSYVICW